MGFVVDGEVWIGRVVVVNVDTAERLTCWKRVERGLGRLEGQVGRNGFEIRLMMGWGMDVNAIVDEDVLGMMKIEGNEFN